MRARGLLLAVCTSLTLTLGGSNAGVVHSATISCYGALCVPPLRLRGGKRHDTEATSDKKERKKGKLEGKRVDDGSVKKKKSRNNNSGGGAAEAEASNERSRKKRSKRGACCTSPYLTSNLQA